MHLTRRRRRRPGRLARAAVVLALALAACARGPGPTALLDRVRSGDAAGWTPLHHAVVEGRADGDARVAADVRLSVNFLQTVYHDRPGHGLTLTVLLSVARGSGTPYARRYSVTSDDASARGKLYQSLADSKAHVSNLLLAGIVRDVEGWIARMPECHEGHTGREGE